MKQFEANVTTIMNYLKSEGFSTSVISLHRRCYAELQEYLDSSGQGYSPEIAYKWIESNSLSWHYRKYTGYRHCIDQLEDTRTTGTVLLDHLSFRKPAYGEIIPLYRSVLDAFIKEHPEADDRHRIASARFLLYLQDNGINSITALDYDILLRFHTEDYHRSSKSKFVYENLIRKFLWYSAEKKMCSPGLPLALNKLLIPQIIKLTEDELKGHNGKVFPKITVEAIDAFLLGMKKSGYGKTVLKSSRHILSLMYIFRRLRNATSRINAAIFMC